MMSSTDNVKDWIVLLVDDTPDNLVVAEMALRYHGAIVYTASSAKEALNLLENVQPTVMLLDIRMPDIDGLTLFRMIRSNPDYQNIPIIAVTAYAMDSDRERVMAAGFDGYISKPFDVTELIDDIKRIIERVTRSY